MTSARSCSPPTVTTSKRSATDPNRRKPFSAVDAEEKDARVHRLAGVAVRKRAELDAPYPDHEEERRLNGVGTRCSVELDGRLDNRRVVVIRHPDVRPKVTGERAAIRAGDLDREHVHAQRRRAGIALNER